MNDDQHHDQHDERDTSAAMNSDMDSDMNDDTHIVPPSPEQTEEPEQTFRYEEPEQSEQTFRYEEPELTVITQPAPPSRSGSHPVNVGQLAMGLVFLAAVGVWALIQSDTVSGDDIRWLLPLPWVIGGGIGLFAAAISSVRRHGVRR